MRTRGRVTIGLALLLVAVVLLAAPTAARAEPATATFTATFVDDAPTDVRAAVGAAMAIWAARLRSVVPIEVQVRWGNGLPRNVAAATEPGGYHRHASTGPMLPAALANARAGYDLDPATPDIRLYLSSGIRWYTGTDGAAPSSATDMVSMVLHELCHGLGFMGSFTHDGHGQMRWGRISGGEVVGLGFDAGLADVGTGSRLTDPAAFANPSAELFEAARSGRVVWAGARDWRGQMPVVYAPRSYEPHSSLAHLDDSAYPAGDPDALMTSLLLRGEVIHSIGPAALGVLADLGWRLNEDSGEMVRRPVVGWPTQPPPTVVAPPAPTTTSSPVAARIAVAAKQVEPAGSLESGSVAADGLWVLAAISLLVVAGSAHRLRR